MTSMMMACSSQLRKVPVVVVSGSFGAGKTSVLSHMLTTSHCRMAIITNDISETGFDLRHLRNRCSGPSKLAGSEVLGGCICCNRREVFLDKINSVARSGGIDYIVVESAGVAEPLHVAENFALVQDVVRLDCMVTVVDAVAASLAIDAMNILSKLSVAARKNMFMKKTLARPRKLFQKSTQLLVEQICFANVILINKCDAVEEGVIRDLCSVIGIFNPTAQISTCTHGKVESSDILHTKLFSMKDAESHEFWFSEASSHNAVFRCCPLQDQIKGLVDGIKPKVPVATSAISRNRRVSSQSTRFNSASLCSPVGPSAWNFEGGWQCVDPTCEEC